MSTMLDDEAPDRRFWTAYDHFMIEREARAMRREYAYSVLRSWLRKWMAPRARIVNAASTAMTPVPPQA